MKKRQKCNTNKGVESSSGPRSRSAAKETCPIQPKEFEVNKQSEGKLHAVHCSEVYSLACQLLVDSVYTTPLSVHVANARQVLRTPTYQSNMHSLIDGVWTMGPATFSEDTHEFSHYLADHLHPVLSYWYSPTDTPPDGNCLWHMISLNLCGTTELMPILRLMTAFAFLENEDYFQDLIRLNENANLSFEQQVAIALHFGAWGGEMHFHALSIVLHRPIYIYNSFLMPGGLNMFLSAADSDQLQDHFRNKKRGTTQHFVYKPPGQQAEIPGRDPLCGIFLGQHYTALLPKSTDPVRFVPSSDITSGGNRYLLSAYFRRPVLSIPSVALRHEE